MIRLEPFERSDFRQLIEWIGNEELLLNWSGSLFRFPLTEKSLAWYIKDTNDIETSEAFVYKATDMDGKMIGHISLGGLSRKNRAARITRVLVGNTGERSKGLCQGMVKAVLKIGFEDLHLHRISLGVYDNNIAAIRCYQKAGLTIEGTKRDILWHKDAWWSLIEMSVLEDEWRNIPGTI